MQDPDSWEKINEWGEPCQPPGFLPSSCSGSWHMGEYPKQKPQHLWNGAKSESKLLRKRIFYGTVYQRGGQLCGERALEICIGLPKSLLSSNSGWTPECVFADQDSITPGGESSEVNDNQRTHRAGTSLISHSTRLRELDEQPWAFVISERD